MFTKRSLAHLRGFDVIANLEAEAALLGLLMVDSHLIDSTADRLRAEDFSAPVHGLIFEAILREHSLGHAANPVTLKTYFENCPPLEELGGALYLFQLTGDANQLHSVGDLSREIADLAKRRRMQAGLEAAAYACEDIETSPAQIIEQADAALQGNASETIHQPTGSECLDELLASYSDKSTGVLCRQISPLDELLGPIRPKQLVVLAARPGMGKTALALSYAIGAARDGHGVLFVSLEMSSVELATRMAADLCFDTDQRIPYNAIRDGSLSRDQFAMVRKARDYLKTLPFNVVDTGSLAIGRLNSLIRRHKRRMAANGHELKLVVVDYLQLLSGDGKSRGNYETVSEVSRGLKAAAKDHGVGIMALAQLSREVEKRPDKRPQLSDLRDSGQIEQDADAVLFLLRQEYYLRQAEPEQHAPDRYEWQAAMQEVEGKIEFILAKRRNGTTGTATGAFHGAFQAVRGVA
jgi:replicative DNA helicase